MDFDYERDICSVCDELHEDCECETSDSVAESLGMYIDDDENWIPFD